MTKEEKEAVSYARERLSIDDYPLYNDEYELMLAFEAGAEWRQSNLWHPVDGDYLPEIDRGVIVLCQPYPLEGSEFAVSFAHRPDPKGWDGKSIVTGKTGHCTPNTYGKGGWSVPNVKYWLDIELPKE